jgi:hypothetical protein
VEAFTDNNNEYQVRDFKAVVEPTDKLYYNDTNNEKRDVTPSRITLMVKDGEKEMIAD